LMQLDRNIWRISLVVSWCLEFARDCPPFLRPVKRAMTGSDKSPELGHLRYWPEQYKKWIALLSWLPT
jgi:hypothetical protein